VDGGLKERVFGGERWHATFVAAAIPRFPAGTQGARGALNACGAERLEWPEKNADSAAILALVAGLDPLTVLGFVFSRNHLAPQLVGKEMSD
jgi:hypothetical protein